MDPRAATQEAESLYTWMCRVVEQQVHDPESKDALVDILGSCPLYLWSKQKEEQVIQYYDDKTIKIFDKMKLPVIMSTHNCCCLLLEQKPLSESEIRFEAYMVARSDDEGEDLLTGIQGQLTLKSTSDGKFNASFGSPAVAIFKINGKHLIPHDDAVHYQQMLQGPLGSEFGKMYAEACTSHMMKAIEFYDYTMRPRVVVVKEVAKKPVKNKKKRACIPRAHQRDVHIVLDPDQVRILKKEAEDKGTHASPAPHTRRAHSRTYKDPRYVNVRGQTLQVKESCIGFREGEEIKTCRRIYHVVSIGDEEEID